MTKKQRFVSHILLLFPSLQESISLPWRRSKDPYKVLVAELMLRKTTRKQVLKIYQLFIEEFPTVKHLAHAPLCKIEKIITPLGMEHKRAYLIRQLAKQLVEKYDGEVPKSREELTRLPGIGDYTANAILCLAYEEDVPLLDTNIARVMHRVFSIPYSTVSRKLIKNMWGAVRELVPKGKAREFNLGIIDFANIICTSRNPKCSECGIMNICDYHLKNVKQ